MNFESIDILTEEEISDLFNEDIINSNKDIISVMTVAYCECTDGRICMGVSYNSTIAYECNTGWGGHTPGVTYILYYGVCTSPMWGSQTCTCLINKSYCYTR